MVNRLATRLNRGGLVGKSPEEFIRTMGGKHLMCLSKNLNIHLYAFGSRHDGEVMFQFNNRFLSGRDAVRTLAQLDTNGEAHPSV